MMKPFNHARIVVVILALTMLSSSLAFVWLHMTSASDGAQLGPGTPFLESPWQPVGVVATPLQEEIDELHQNDVITAVNGISLQTWMQTLTSSTIERPQWKLGQLVVYRVIRKGIPLDVPVRLRAYPLGSVLSAAGTFLIAMAFFQCIATYVFWYRSNENVVLILFLWASCASSAIISVSIGLQISDIVSGFGFWLYKVTTFGAFIIGMFAAVRFALYFPQPHPLISKYPFVPWFISAVLGTTYLIYLVITRLQTLNILSWIGFWDSSWVVFVVVCLGIIVASVVLNHRYASYPNAVTRRQARLVVFAITVAGILGFTFGLLPRILLGHLLIDRNLLPLFPSIFVTALTVAILRYRLFGIDILINRTLVYILLTALVFALYILIVGLLSEILHESGNLPVSLIATGLIAFVFQALRNRVQSAVNRLMYGERDNPYAVLSRLGQRLEDTLAPDAVLPSIVETVAYALKLSYAAIALKEGTDFAIVTAYGLPRGDLLRLPLIYQGETIGQLILGSRALGEGFTSADRRLLNDLAHQAGIAANTVRLTADLQRSREHLVTTREEERRRLRRDLHDGLGPVLASMSFSLDAIYNLIRNNPDAARTQVSELKSQIQTSLDDIRRIAYNLRPPALDELGLIGALKEHIITYNQCNDLQIVLQASKESLHLGAAVEVAAYRIAMEAMTNVVRHAHAQHCLINLSVNEALSLEIIDDGQGILSDERVGVGITSMRERAEELGGTCVIESIPTGGTQVLVQLPLPAAERSY